MSLLSRIINLFRTRALDADFDEELDLHVDQRIADNLRSGMSIEAATVAAHERFGSRERAKSGMREARIMSKFVAGLIAGVFLAAIPVFFLWPNPDQEPSLPPGFYFPGENGVSMPSVVREQKPQYTAAALQDRVSGTVRMTCVVQPDGTCNRIRIMPPGLRDDLDAQAIRALEGWRFQPATLSGRPVAALVDVEMAYTLK
jgi:TonB family protein